MADASNRSEGGDRKGASLPVRLSPLIARGGTVALPVSLLVHAGRLGLTSNELCYIAHVLHRKWTKDWPFLSVGEVAASAGVDVRSARSWKASLIGKGYLRVYPRVVPGQGPRADVHDLGGLFARLEALVLEDELRRARGELPEVEYHQGISTTPPLSTGRSARRLRPRAEGNTRSRADETIRSLRKNASTRGGTKTPAEEEPVKEEPGTRDRSQEAGEKQPARTNRVAAARPGPKNPAEGVRKVSAEDGRMLEGHVAHAEPDGASYRPATDSEVSAAKDRLTAEAEQLRDQQRISPAEPVGELPVGYDEGIWLYIERFAPAFGDNDPARSLEVAHHLWWNSGLPAWAFHNAIKMAADSTERMLARGHLRSSPMGYFFSALKTAVHDQAVRYGTQAS